MNKKMDKRIGFIFRLFYMTVAMFSWYVAYQIYKIRGFYPRELPRLADNGGQEEIRKYAHHFAFGWANIATVWGYCSGTTIGAAIGMMDFMIRKSLWVNLLMLSIMLNVTWGMIYVLEWCNIIG